MPRYKAIIVAISAPLVYAPEPNTRALPPAVKLEARSVDSLLHWLLDVDPLVTTVTVVVLSVIALYSLYVAHTVLLGKSKKPAKRLISILRWIAVIRHGDRRPK